MSNLPPKRHVNSPRPTWTGEQFQAASMRACELALEGLETDGAHHKQWYLEQIAEALGINLEHYRRSTDTEWEPGIAP